MIAERNIANISVMFKLTIERNPLICDFIDNYFIIPSHKVEITVRRVRAPLRVHSHENPLSDTLMYSGLLLSNKSLTSFFRCIEVPDYV